MKLKTIKVELNKDELLEILKAINDSEDEIDGYENSCCPNIHSWLGVGKIVSAYEEILGEAFDHDKGILWQEEDPPLKNNHLYTQEMIYELGQSIKKIIIDNRERKL